jgi:diaminohydroxyphosphoribosylaminopyrimidine deaminase/5-amino-6-(5-phosphoribosylamino)uracil reductase
MQTDETWMLRAIQLARKGEGLTRPNPPVGAVIVRRDQVVGEGFHRKAGTAHAEIHALKQAGAKARGATLYISLEPCSTWGKTPPCTDAIVAAGIRRVVYAVRDPNPRHSGRATRALKRRGLQVAEGVCRHEAEELIRPFATWIRKHRPYITLKLAVSLDGRIADRDGKSQWISGPVSRKRVHELRRAVDGIMVGMGTFVADKPRLTPRPAKGRAPLKIVVRRESVRVLARRLGRMGLLHVVCEGGGKLAEKLVKAGLVDEFWFFIAPVLVGGPMGAMRGTGWKLPGAPRLRFTAWEHLGKDLLLRAVPE